VRAFLKGGGGGAAGEGGGGGGVVVVMLVCLGAAAALGACRFQRVGEAVQQVPNELEPRICLVCVQVADCTWWWWCGLWCGGSIGVTATTKATRCHAPFSQGWWPCPE